LLVDALPTVQPTPEISDMRLLVPLLCAALVAAGCAKKLDQSTPEVSGASPGALCHAQLDNVIAVTGSGFSPLVESSLTEQRRLVLPRVELLQTRNIDGEAATGTFEVPDDGHSPESSAVRWLDQGNLVLTLTPEMSLKTGLHDLRVTNSGGGSATLAGALLSVPPPEQTSLSQDIACGAQPNTVTLTGDYFIRQGGQGPTVRVGEQAFTPTLEDCRPLPGEGGYEACTKATVEIPAGTLAAGGYQVSVHNPAPVGCQTQSTLTFTVFDAPQITSVVPMNICSDADTQDLVISGTGFLTVDGQLPGVTIGTQALAPTASDCTPVTGTSQQLQACSTLTVTVATGTFGPGSYPVIVQNPAPVDCASSEPFALLVTAPPTLSSVAPSAVCAGNPTLTLEGTGFGDGASVTLDGLQASSVEVVSGQTAVARFPGGVATGGPYDVTLTNPDGCSATAQASVTVIPGPQIFFVDPSIVYNGITVQATLYGTGFTGTVQGVQMTPSGGGTPVTLDFTYDPARPNQVQVLIPSGTPAGQYDFELEDTTACLAVLANAITVVDQTELVVSRITPEFGWTGEDTPVTIDGIGFLPVPRLYLNPETPGPTTVATAIGAVSFLDSSTLTALVPTPALPAGIYDLIVVNPDGKVGLLSSAFRVESLPPPLITSLSPGSVANTNPQSFTVEGRNFRQPEVTLQCVDGSGTLLATQPSATVTSSTATTVNVTFNASAAGVACVVRVTNLDNQTFGDFSALVITNPAQNLYAAVPGPNLDTARRAPVALKGDATIAARYLHVVGGDDGVGAAYDTVESSALTLLGVPQPFMAQRNRLTQARTFAAGTTIGRYLYVAGGSNSGVALDTVERAAVLDPARRGQISDLILEVDRVDGLGPGVWYYRVAPMMDANDAFNPGGEDLPSDPFPVQLPDLNGTRFVVTVNWKVTPGATGYRVYRSPTAGATVGEEEVIAEVAAPSTSFVDRGAAPISADRPLPIGSLGVWHTVGTLSVPREGPGVGWGLDPADPAMGYLYVMGGRQDSATALASYELLPFAIGADGSQTVAPAFLPGAATIGTARWQLGVSRATSELSSFVAPGVTYLYALSGLAAGGTTTVSSAVAGQVQAGGQLAFTNLLLMSRAGYFTTVAGNFVFAFGGNQASPDATIASGEICGPGVAGCGLNSAPQIGNWNTGQNMLVPRYLMGGALSGAFMYVVGGVTSTNPLTVASSTEYRLW
jgi:hypothetical protein